MSLLILSFPFAAGLILLAWGLYLALSWKSPSFQERTLVLKGHSFAIAIADTARKRAQGLSGLRAIAADEAMLFLFHAPRRYFFWMKGMRFPIDIVWLRNETVVEVSENVSPRPGTIVRPKVAVDAVLELNAGLAGKLGITAGDKILSPHSD